jgi:hypothetical protein
LVTSIHWPKKTAQLPAMPGDPELHTVRYAFDAAFQRMCAATTDDELIAEHSNLLHHLYRLRLLCIRRLPGYDMTEKSNRDLRVAAGASWVRNSDTHQLFGTASNQDVYSDYFTARYGVLVWKPLGDLPAQLDRKHHREADYKAELDGKGRPRHLAACVRRDGRTSVMAALTSRPCQFSFDAGVRLAWFIHWPGRTVTRKHESGRRHRGNASKGDSPPLAQLFDQPGVLDAEEGQRAGIPLPGHV